MKTIEFGMEGYVATITMNRPEKLNALSREMRIEFIDALRRVNSDDRIRAVVITGAGNAFCVGADLDSMPGSLSADLYETFHPIMRGIRFSPKIYVAAVNGVAAGAGISIAVACDLRYCSKGTRFVTAFHRIGLVPDTGLSYMLPRLVQPSSVYELLLAGGEMTAAEAEKLSLFRISEDPLTDAVHRARAISEGPFQSYSLSKKLLNRAVFGDGDAFLKEEAEAQEELGKSSDFREGISAFREKRKPVFSGN